MKAEDTRSLKGRNRINDDLGKERSTIEDNPALGIDSGIRQQSVGGASFDS